ncbi:MAG: hypothetical protein QM831_12400 [Kofleriaceae bacterium]
MRAAVLLVVAACNNQPASHSADAANPRDGIVFEDAPSPTDLSYITLDPGWTVEVWRDVTTELPYVDADFTDGTEVYSNIISRPFLLSGTTFGDRLGIVSGRRMAIFDGVSFELHDYGQHAPNTPGVPDALSSVAQNNTSLYVTSTSANGGDGIFSVAADWTISSLTVINNTRYIVVDGKGTFDNAGVLEVYYGDLTGVTRLGAGTKIVTSTDANSLAINNGTLIYVEYEAEDMATVYSVASATMVGGMHTKVPAFTSTDVLIGPGPPATSGKFGWAVVTSNVITEVGGPVTGNIPDGVAVSSDAAALWTGVLSVPTGHPLYNNGPTLFVTEYNTTVNRSRILRLTKH